MFCRLFGRVGRACRVSLFCLSYVMVEHVRFEPGTLPTILLLLVTFRTGSGVLEVKRHKLANALERDMQSCRLSTLWDCRKLLINP